MWLSSHIRILVTLFAIANIFGPLASSSPVYVETNELSEPSNDQSDLIDLPPHLGRAIRMLAEDPSADDKDDGDKDDEGKEEKEKLDEDKKEEVDEDLKSDEVKDEDDDDDDEDEEDVKKGKR